MYVRTYVHHHCLVRTYVSVNVSPYVSVNVSVNVSSYVNVTYVMFRRHHVTYWRRVVTGTKRRLRSV